jgi:hypothetical protein
MLCLTRIFLDARNVYHRKEGKRYRKGKERYERSTQRVEGNEERGRELKYEKDNSSLNFNVLSTGFYINFKFLCIVQTDTVINLYIQSQNTDKTHTYILCYKIHLFSRWLLSCFACSLQTG